MENIQILAENIIQIDEVKEEPMDHIGESSLNSIVKQEPEDHAVDHVVNLTEGGELCSLKREVKQEDEEEVKPPVGIFLSALEESNDELQQLQEDPLASCSEHFHGAGAEADGVEGKAIWEERSHLPRGALRRRSATSGARAQAVKRRKFEKHLGFALPNVTDKTQEGNVNEAADGRESPPKNCGIDDSTEVVEHHAPNTQQGMRSALDEALPQAPPETSSRTRAPILTPTAIDTKSAKRKKKETVADLLQRRIQQHEERGQSRSEERRRILEQMRAPSDSLYHFFLSMYGVTKNMPLSSQMAVRKDVSRVVSAVKATLLNIPAGDQRASFHDRSSSDRSSSRPSSRSSTAASPFPFDETAMSCADKREKL